MTCKEAAQTHKKMLEDLRKLHVTKQESTLCNISQQSIDTKSNINVYIPDDVYKEINNLLLYPKSKNKKVTFKQPKTESAGKNIVSKQYATELLMLDEKIFVFPKRTAMMVKKAFELSYLCTKTQQRFCLCCKRYVQNNVQNFYEHVRSRMHINNFKKMIKDSECLVSGEQFLKKTSDRKPMTSSNHPKAIKEHSKNQNHKQIFLEPNNDSNCQWNGFLEEFEHCWYNIQTYACTSCTQKFAFKPNFLQHLHEKHKEEKNIIYDFCIPCAVLWTVCQDKYTYLYEIHCTDIMHKYMVSNLNFAIRNIPQHAMTLLKHAEENAENLFKLSEEIFKNDEAQKLLESLKSSLSTRFPKLQIYPFGSRLMGLGFPSSNIDIFLDCEGNSCDQSKSSSLIHNYIDSTKDSLWKDKDTWFVREVLKNVKIPIIKLIHRSTGLQCDISFTSNDSVQVTKLIRSFNKAFPQCRKLILFVKKWHSLCSLPGQHRIKNYALTWCVIFYLQTRKILPSVDTLIRQKDKSKLICGGKVGIDYEIPAISTDVSFSELLIGFFDFYGDFNYKDYVACPLLGDVVRKQDFINMIDLPSIVQRNLYVHYRIDSLMYVQDPFDLSHNLTKAVQPLTLKAFRQYCRDSKKSLIRINSLNKK